MSDSDHNLGWLVGIYEGEGTCGMIPRARGAVKAPGYHTRVMIGSTDRDVLETIQGLTGYGSIVVVREATVTTKKYYRWSIQNFKDVLDFCQMVYPHLHTRRQEQMKPLMDFCAERIANPVTSGPAKVAV